MKDELITFETAKLAQGKGFRGGKSAWFDSITAYDKEGNIITELSGNIHHYAAPAPTQSLLQRWLREKHQWYVIPFVDDDGTFGYESCMIGVGGRLSNPLKRGFETYEESLEKGLQEALKHVDK